MLYRPGVNTVADMVIEEAMKYLGTPYRWGGKTPKGFDCAGFTRYIYGKFGVPLAPAAAPQYKMGTALKKEDIRKGDLVFYGGRGSSRSIGHVGIVVSVDSNGFKFIHSATSTGICISSSNEAYYRSRYIGACRVVDQVVSNLPANDMAERKEIPVYRQVIFFDTQTTPLSYPYSK
ncbi:MAG: C40 family peptidase [Bacteroidales bacterium]|nr:C40 family peptidase [Bacteroidales bacterium]